MIAEYEIEIPKQEKKKKKQAPDNYIDSRVNDTIWQEIVPIVTEGKVHTIYIASGIEEPVEYTKLVHMLGMLSKNDIVRIILNTPGGIIDAAFMIINAIKNCQAKTIAIISGTVASAGTIITLACDEIEVADYTSFMIHNYIHSTGGSGSQVKAYVDFTDRELNSAFREIYKGFLSKEEMDDVIENDREIWLNKSEVLTRWAQK